MSGEISTQMIQWDGVTQERLRALWLAFYTNTKIADIFNCTPGAVAAQAWKMKLPYRERSDFHKFMPVVELELWPPRLAPIPPQPKPAEPPPAPKLNPPSGRVLAVKVDKPPPEPEPEKIPRPKRVILTPEERREKARIYANEYAAKKRAAKAEKDKTNHQKVTRKLASQVLPRGPVKITKDTRVWSNEENQAEIDRYIATKGITQCLPPSQIPVVIDHEKKAWGVRQGERQRIMLDQNRWRTFRQQTFARRVS